MPKISAIVPVYNTEKYLTKCLNSIINQTYQDFEIIIVNDGSTDNSEKIILEFKNKYPEKIKYLKKENGGLSNARNFGVEHAKGDYLSFIDSDDYIDINLFEKLIPYIDQSIDLIKFKLIKVTEDYQKIEKIDGPIFDKINGQDAFNKLCFSDILLEPACLYFYKRSFFVENKYKFALNLYHEDFGLIPIIIINATSVASVDYYGYYYVQANNSITRNNNYEKSVKRAYDLLLHYDNMIMQLNKINLSRITENNLKQYYTNAIFNNLINLKKNEKRMYKKQIKQRHLIKNIKIKNCRSFAKKIFLFLKCYYL
ncbi:MAG: glycosyltransferase [Clostridia bacterium]|nr:glycosyltransferase [Clostridia bacterium]